MPGPRPHQCHASSTFSRPLDSRALSVRWCVPSLLPRCPAPPLGTLSLCGGALPVAASSAAPAAATAAPMLSTSSLVLRSAAFAPPRPLMPSRTLCADRASVRDLRVALKLEGVRVFENGVRCVPLMGYESSST